MHRMVLVVVLVGVIAVAAIATSMVAGGEVSATAFGVTASSPFGLRADASGDEAAVGGIAPMRIVSEPDGAQVMIDGHDRGRTPVVARVAPGAHTLVLKHPDTLDDARQVDAPEDGTSLSVELWRRRPSASQLRPPYPGATIADATFLADGRLATAIAIPERESIGTVGSWLEPWLLDPSTGTVTRFETRQFAAARSRVVSVSPDSRRVAYLQQSPPGTTQSVIQSGRLNEVWVAAADGSALERVFALPSRASADSYAPTEVERLIDVVWTPDGGRLLVATRIGDPLSGPVRGRLLVVDTAAPGAGSPPLPIELVTMPATIVPGSYSWAPLGHWVAFMARASAAPGGKNFVTLDAVDINSQPGGGFRYLADLGRADGTAGSASLALPPVAWEPLTEPSMAVGRLLYSGPVPAARNGVSSSPFGLLSCTPPEPKQGLFVATPDGPALGPEQQRRVGSATGLLAPVWRSSQPESVLTLTRGDGGDKVLAARLVDPTTGRIQDAGIQLPATLAPGTDALAARWDEVHGRAIIVARKASGASVATPTGDTDSLDFWLVQFTTQTAGADSH